MVLTKILSSTTDFIIDYNNRDCQLSHIQHRNQITGIELYCIVLYSIELYSN